MPRGTLYLIVGPSGAGKDSLMRAAGKILADDQGFVFARRVITRPLDPDRESHEPVDADEFERRRRNWRLHAVLVGLCHRLRHSGRL